jgi:protoheme IX farnesyltransferase
MNSSKVLSDFEPSLQKRPASGRFATRVLLELESPILGVFVPSNKATISDFIALTKPRIIELLLVTTIPTMIFAAKGWPPVSVAIATFIGGTFAAAGANVLNCYLDYDIDVLMPRTSKRATAQGRIAHRTTLIYGLVLSAISIILLRLTTNGLAAALAALAIIFYVGIYTLLLKRRTPQNIVWGGIAGCFPVVIGWSAVTDSLSWEPVALFLVVFFWTPPHYWPLSMRFRDEYEAAQVPMLPVVASDEVVARQILIYSYAMVGSSLTLIYALSWIYAILSIASGIWFLKAGHDLRAMIAKYEFTQDEIDKSAMKLFHASITYLSVIFFAVGLDALILH